MANVRHLAVITLRDAEEHNQFLEDAVAASLARVPLSAQDRRFLTQLTHECARRKMALDYALNVFSKKPMAQLPALTRIILRLGALQVLFFDHVPNAAAVNEMVNVAHKVSHRGTAGYVNAVLRSLIRGRNSISWPDRQQDPLNYIHIVQSFPRWLGERWQQQLGPAGAVTMAEALNRRPKSTARHNWLRIGGAELHAALRDVGLWRNSSSLIPDAFVATSHQQLLQHQGLLAGWFYIQSEASCLPAYAGQLRPGLSVIDLCSAPGGKTAHIAERMGNTGNLTAVDQSPDRLATLRSNLDRLGVRNVEIVCGDAGELRREPCARVFLDAPCSGLGTLNHKPDMRWQKSPAQIAQLAAVQRRLLNNAARLTAPGGLLIYSTCTTEPSENEDQVRWFLDTFPDFQPEPLPHWFPAHKHPGMLQIWPHVHDTDGFFVAALRRRQNCGLANP